MSKNPKILYAIIVLLIVIIFIGIGIIGGIWKSEDQKWSEMIPLLKDEAEIVINGSGRLLSEEDFAIRNYDRFKSVNCKKLIKLSDQNECDDIKDVFIRQIEKPETIRKPGESWGELKSAIMEVSRLPPYD